jgi:hypothetical protein
MYRMQRVELGSMVGTLTFAAARSSPSSIPPKIRARKTAIPPNAAGTRSGRGGLIGCDCAAGGEQVDCSSKARGMLNAALGEGGGAIAGDAGKGAAIGAVVRTAMGVLHQCRQERCCCRATTRDDQLASQQMATFTGRYAPT